jgi:hypothetical protein
LKTSSYLQKIRCNMSVGKVIRCIILFLLRPITLNKISNSLRGNLYELGNTTVFSRGSFSIIFRLELLDVAERNTTTLSF